MGIIELIIIIVIVGAVVLLIQKYAPIPNQFKTIILWIAIIAVALLVLSAFGILGKDVAIPRIR